WLAAMMHPPSAGMCSPPDQSRLVVASSVGLRIATAIPNASPRFSCNLRRVTTPPRPSAQHRPRDCTAAPWTGRTGHGDDWQDLVGDHVVAARGPADLPGLRTREVVG